RMGILGATGLIVGESLFGVLYAGIVAGSGSDAPLAVVGDGFEPIAMWGGIGVFVALVWWIYRRMRQLA
ncbi:MAG: oligopeptide transporter, OPT family, partial [Sphingorhabdus sp.]